MKFNEEDVNKFYMFFLHSQPTEIRVFDAVKYPKGKSIFVKNRKEFVNECRKYTEEGVSVYVGARDRKARGDKNVINSNFIFFETDGDKDGAEKKKILEFLTSKEIEVSMIGMSGGGWHFYIPHRKVEFATEAEAIEYKENSLGGFKKIIIEQGFNVDPAVFNLERVTRVLGTFNCKREKLSYIESINDEVNITRNTRNLISLIRTETAKKTTAEKNTTQTTLNVDNHEDDAFIKEVKSKWKEGKRQEIAISLAGYLRKEKRLGLQSTIGIITRICEDCGDKDIQERINGVRATFSKDEKDIKGAFGLIENRIELADSSMEVGKINWCKEDGLNNWKDIKVKLKRDLGAGEKYYDKEINWFFAAHSQDEVIGKPQLVDPIKKNIILAREVKTKSNGEEIRGIVTFDEKFDKRYSGQMLSLLSFDFFMYRIITEEGKEHYILSEEHLPNEMCNFSGMLIDVEDFTEVTKSMKMGSLTSVMIMKDCKSNVVTLEPRQLLEFTKSRGFTEEKWFEFLAFHRDLNSFNRFPHDVELLKSAHLLSGKIDGWPMHLGIIGPQGTRKSKGFIETIAYKMSENPEIFEGANSRIKGLTPSFKEKPANLGYFANSHRMGWIDELGKMVEFEINKHNGDNRNVLGEANFLLEHSMRQVGSGNDNTATVEATAKFVFVTNPISRRRTIGEHVGFIDPTTMSRIFWWVQDHAEQDFVVGPKGIIRNKSPPEKGYPHNTITRNRFFSSSRYSRSWLSVGGILENTDEFLTLYDSCNAFTCIFDDERILQLAKVVETLARDPMKSVWKTRAEHHVSLLVDGICKHRCLFKDFDGSFTANNEDYINAERILTRMVKGWETIL